MGRDFMKLPGNAIRLNGVFGVIEVIGVIDVFRTANREIGVPGLSGGGEGLAFGEDVLGDFAEIADDVEPGKHFQRVEGDVHFPPVKALARAGHVVVMIVVPAFAEGDEREHPVVLAGVCGGKAAARQECAARETGEIGTSRRDVLSSQGKRKSAKEKAWRNARCWSA